MFAQEDQTASPTFCLHSTVCFRCKNNYPPYHSTFEIFHIKFSRNVSDLFIFKIYIRRYIVIFSLEVNYSKNFSTINLHYNAVDRVENSLVRSDELSTTEFSSSFH